MNNSPKLEWTAHCRWESTHYTSGIYKISSYIWNKNREVKRYYSVYKLAAVNWGDYLYPHLQGETMMTLKEAKALAQRHQDEFGEATEARKSIGDKAIARWMGRLIA